MTIVDFLNYLEGFLKNYPEIAKSLGATIAIIALFFTWRTHAERASFDMIDRMYATWNSVESDLKKDWYLSHLLCVDNDDYYKTVDIIKKSLSQDLSKSNENLVKESILAIQIFMIYEQVYFQWKYSGALLHRGRKKFLKAALDYFANRLLQNPRLSFYLDSDTASANKHLEDESKAYIEKTRRSLRQKPNVDNMGPFIQMTSDEYPDRYGRESSISDTKVLEANNSKRA